MKSFIRGMGVGIIASTLIIALTYGVTKDKISNEEIIRKAEALGMVKQTETIFNTEKPNTTTDVSSATNEVSTAAVTTTSQSVNAIPEVTLPPIQEKVILTVLSGEDGLAVSRKLKELGVIDDAKSFNEYLKKNQLQKRIQVGDFEITKGMKYEDIVNTIIK